MIVTCCLVMVYNWYFPLTQDGTTPLNIACENGHSDVVNILISNGADVNKVRPVR